MPRQAALAALLASVALSGCVSIVSVRSEGGRPHVGVYPFGVRVSRGAAAAVSVSARTAGLWSGCYAAGAGLGRVDCDVIDIRACSVALVHAPVADPNLLDGLVGATRAYCPKPPGEPCTDRSCSSPPASSPSASAPATR